MCDGDGRSTLDQIVEGFLNLAFRFGINRRGSFNENQNSGIGEQRASNRDALPFATGK